MAKNLAPPPELKKIYLPTTDNLPETERWWVQIKTGKLLGGDVLSVADVSDEDMALKQMITRRIVDWNVTDNDLKAEITADNVSRLEPEDIKFLIIELGFGSDTGLSEDQKKSSLTSSEPPLTV